MPFESRIFVKTGIVYLLLTFVLGAAMLVAQSLGVQIPFVVEVEHGHLGFVGWLVNVVMGVALWMFPLDRERFPDTQGRYPAAAPLWCFCLLNCGLVVRVVVEPWLQLSDASGAMRIAGSALLAASGIAQLAAVVIFVAIVWSRTRGPNRPAPGVR